MNIRLSFLCLALTLMNCSKRLTSLYVGTYTDTESKGIYSMQFNTNTGELSHLKLAGRTENPSFISFSPDKKYLYAVGETDEGFVSAFKVKKNGELQFLNQVKSHGGSPCYVSLNKEGNKAAVANYSGGNMALFNIDDNGFLNEANQIFEYNTPDKKSHAHSVQFFDENLYVSDLGMNAVYQYQLNADNTYTLTSPSIVTITENAGPRHFSLTKDGDYIYIISEYANTITAVKKIDGQINLIDHYSTLATDFIGDSYCADIHLSKDQNFLYGSNRGENSIAVFKRNTSNGTLDKIQNIDVHGDWPRNFTIDPTGNFLLVANQRSGNIVVFGIDKQSGKLTFLQDYKTPTPVCLLF